MPTPTYTLIASTTLTGSQASVTFSSIPSTYTDLVLRVSARSSRSGTSNNMSLNINSDSSTLYSYTNIYSSASSALAQRSTNDTSIFVGTLNAATSQANTFTSADIYIPSYTVSQSKPFASISAYENNTAPPATTNEIDINANLYRSNTAISSLTLYSNYGIDNFVSGSTFYLYGIKNA